MLWDLTAWNSFFQASIPSAFSTASFLLYNSFLPKMMRFGGKFSRVSRFRRFLESLNSRCFSLVFSRAIRLSKEASYSGSGTSFLPAITIVRPLTFSYQPPYGCFHFPDFVYVMIADFTARALTRSSCMLEIFIPLALISSFDV